MPARCLARLADPNSHQQHRSSRRLAFYDINGAEIVKRFKEHNARSRSIAGFQGVGRGERRKDLDARPRRSDPTAVAVTTAIQADQCDIYTDVNSVYTTDPNVVPRTERSSSTAYKEMLEFASLGAKVLQVRSVELGMVHKVHIFVRSSFDQPEDIDRAVDPPGTLICDEEDIVEQQVVTGIAFSKDEAQISVRHVQDKPGVAAAILGPLAGGGDQRRHDRAERFCRRRHHRPHVHGAGRRLPALARRLDKSKGAIGFDHIDGSTDVAKVSVIGIGMRSHAGVAAQAFKALAGPQHQHPGHHHVGDQVLGADRRGLHRACGAHAAFAVRTG